MKRIGIIAFSLGVFLCGCGSIDNKSDHHLMPLSHQGSLYDRSSSDLRLKIKDKRTAKEAYKNFKSGKFKDGISLDRLKKESPLLYKRIVKDEGFQKILRDSDKKGIKITIEFEVFGVKVKLTIEIG